MLIYETGDLVKGGYEIFCHQVNCRGVMGAGIAKQIKETYPEVYKRYREKCLGGNNTLGKIVTVNTVDGRTCVNMFSQNDFGTDKVHTDYNAFKLCLRRLSNYIQTHRVDKSARIAFPYKIGCGLAGGDWNEVEKLIKDFTASIQQDVVIVRLK